MRKREKREWLLEMDDPRNKSYITYTQADLFYMGLLNNEENNNG